MLYGLYYNDGVAGFCQSAFISGDTLFCKISRKRHKDMFYIADIRNISHLLIILLAFVVCIYSQGVDDGSGNIPVVIEKTFVGSNRHEASTNLFWPPLWIRSFWKESMRCQASAIIDVLQQYNWTYINAVQSENSFVFSAFNEFITQLKDAGICLHNTFRLPQDASNSKEVFDMMIHDLTLTSESSVVVLYLSRKDLVDFMDLVASRIPADSQLVWLVNDELGEIPGNEGNASIIMTNNNILSAGQNKCSL